jgi:hypothetical protein
MHYDTYMQTRLLFMPSETARQLSKKSPTSAMYRARSSQNGV